MKRKSVFTMFKTPAGIPTSLAMSPSSRQVKLAYSDGFKMTVHPAANAGATFHVAINNG